MKMFLTHAANLRMKPLTTAMVVTLLVLGLGAGAALAQVKTWSAKDAKGRAVNTANFSGKVQVITISNPDYKYKKATDKTLEFMAGKFGKSDDVIQLTLVDLRSMGWAKYKAADVSGELDKRMRKAHDRVAGRIAKALGYKGNVPGDVSSKIDKGLHLIPTRDGDIVGHYNSAWSENTTSNNLIVVVVDKSGKKHSKHWAIKKNASEANIQGALDEIAKVVESYR